MSRPHVAFMSRACGKGQHHACAEKPCTCFCHQNLYESAAALLAHPGNIDDVLELMGLPHVYDDDKVTQ